MLRTVHMRMKQVFAPNATAKPQAGAFVILTSSTILG